MANFLDYKIKAILGNKMYIMYLPPPVTLDEFISKIRDLCNVADSSHFNIKYLDRKNKLIAIASTEELIEAFIWHAGYDKPEITVYAFTEMSSEPCAEEYNSIVQMKGQLKKFYKINGHILHREGFYPRSNCAVCGDRVWGLGAHALRCLKCRLLVHKRCNSSITMACVILLDKIDNEYVEHAENKEQQKDNKKTDQIAGDRVGSSSEAAEGCCKTVKKEGKLHTIKTASNEPFKYDLDSFTLIKVVGQGAFGKVLKAELKSTKKVYAIKALKKNVMCIQNDFKFIKTERYILEKVDYPFLVNLHVCFQTSSHLFFVMDFAAGGNFREFLKEHRRLNEAGARFYGAEIALALNYLHERGIIFRDLKLENILMDHEGHVKLTDYGLCKKGVIRGGTTGTFCGTPTNIAPEVIKRKMYSFGVDWWAFGVILYEFLTGLAPFNLTPNLEELNEQRTFRLICEENVSYPFNLSKPAISVLKKLLKKKPGKRLGSDPQTGFSEVKSHEFFACIDWNRIEAKRIETPYLPNLDMCTSIDPKLKLLNLVDQCVIDDVCQKAFEGFDYISPILEENESSEK